MNLRQLKKDVGCRVQLAPVARWLDETNRELPPEDDEWIIEDVTDESVRIFNTHTGLVITLGKDHVHSFASNPQESTGGIKHGFLVLHVQVYMRGAKCWVRPNLRPGEAGGPGVCL